MILPSAQGQQEEQISKKQKKKSEVGNERKRETHYPTQKDPKEMLVNEYYSEIHEI